MLVIVFADIEGVMYKILTVVRNPVWAAETGAVSHSPAHKTRSWGEKREIHGNVRQIDTFYKKKCVKKNKRIKTTREETLYDVLGTHEQIKTYDYCVVFIYNEAL